MAMGPFIVGGVVGWLIRGPGQAPEPVDAATAIERLRQNNRAVTYRVITLDLAQARTNQSIAFEGNFIGIKHIDGTVDLKIRLNEEHNDLLNLTRLRQIKNHLYYRFFVTHEAGAGTVELYCALGAEFIPPDDTQVDVTSDVLLISGTLASRPAPSLSNRLYWAVDAKILYRDTGDLWEVSSSVVTFNNLDNRPAAGVVDRWFFATDTEDLYRDDGEEWTLVATRTPALHGLTNPERHGPGLLADLNALVSDATLDDAGDPRTPTAHGNEAHDPNMATAAELASHEADGGAHHEAFTSGDHAAIGDSSPHHGEDHASRHEPDGDDVVSDIGMGTVSQAEAEAGTATDRRIWTAQRAHQAAGGATRLKLIPDDDQIIEAADTQRNSALLEDFEKLKEFSLEVGTQVEDGNARRITFRLRSTGAGQEVRAIIRRNGSDVGTLRSNDITSFVTFTEDIDGWSDGDACELWAGRWGNGGAVVDNYRLLGRLVPSDGVVTD